MGTKAFVGLVCLVAAAAAVGRFWPGGLGRLWPAWAGPVPRLGSDAPDAPSPAAAGLRKCVREGRLLYTNQACPQGSREQALSAGSVTVLPATPVAALPGSAASGPPTVRDLLTDGHAVDITDKRMDEIIGK
jgi:hypothetical protein